MVECETSRGLCDGSLTSQAIGAGPEGPLPAREAAPLPAPMVGHGHTLQYLISIIKTSQQRNPATIERRKDGDS
jgi:hypothetical protein